MGMIIEDIELRAVEHFKEAFSFGRELSSGRLSDPVKAHLVELGIPLTYQSPLNYVYHESCVWHVKMGDALIATVSRKDDFYAIARGYLLGKVYRERNLTYKGEEYEKVRRCLPAFDDSYVSMGISLYDKRIRPINRIIVMPGIEDVGIYIQGFQPYFVQLGSGFKIFEWRSYYGDRLLSINDSNANFLRFYTNKADPTTEAINQYIGQKMMYLLGCTKRQVTFDTDEKGRKPVGILEIELTTGLQFV